MANYLPVLGEFTMLSQANINMLDLAYTHAQSAKKKTSLEVVFIKLYLTDSILNILHKDYSMLERFKVYYKK